MGGLNKYLHKIPWSKYIYQYIYMHISTYEFVLYWYLHCWKFLDPSFFYYRKRDLYYHQLAQHNLSLHCLKPFHSRLFGTSSCTIARYNHLIMFHVKLKEKKGFRRVFVKICTQYYVERSRWVLQSIQEILRDANDDKIYIQNELPQIFFAGVYNYSFLSSAQCNTQ